MRYRTRVLGAVAVLGLTTSAQAQPGPDGSVKELPPRVGDSFTDPIFEPPGGRPRPAPVPPPKPPDHAAACEPLAIPKVVKSLTDAVSGCACSSAGYTTWLTGEWVIGTTRGPSLVPVVTTGPASAGVLAGAVGQPTTLPLFGGHPVLNDWRSGLRVEAGVWFDPDHRTGLSARFYALTSVTEAFASRPLGATVVNVPQFTSTALGTVQTPLFVSFPGTTVGSVVASTRTSFGGGDVNLRRLLYSTEDYRIELLGGYRQLHLGDEIGTAFNVTTANALAAAQLVGGDRLRTSNNFYGPQLGVYGSARWNRFTLEGHAASALGATVSDLDTVRTRTLSTSPVGTPLANTAALVALGVPPATAATIVSTARTLGTTAVPVTRTSTSNTLTYFGVVGEGGGRVSWHATEHVRLTAGYSFIYWNNARRAQELFASGGELRPRAVDFSTHLFSVGLDLRY